MTHPLNHTGQTAPLFDVRAVNIKTHAERLMDSGLTADNAEAYIKFAVMRRGCDEEFYVAVPMGQTHFATPN